MEGTPARYVTLGFAVGLLCGVFLTYTFLPRIQEFTRWAATVTDGLSIVETIVRFIRVFVPGG